MSKFQLIPARDFIADVQRLIRPPHIARYKSVRWEDIGRELKPPDWLIKGLLQANDVSILAGPSQAGKSFIATDIALAVARGVQVDSVDKPERVALAVPQQRGVIYIAAESARGVVQLRLPAYKQYHGLDDTRLPLAVITQPVNFFAVEKDVDDLIADCKAIIQDWQVPLGLIVIDTFSASTPGLDEIKGAEISKVKDRINRLRAAMRAHVMIVHHMNAGGERVRGHSSLTADIETVILCAQTDEQDIAHGDVSGPTIRDLVIDKQKDAAAGLKFRFCLEVIELGKDEDGEPVTSCVCVPPKHNTRIPAGKDALGMVALSPKEAIVMRALNEAIKKSGETNPRDVKSPSGVECVRINVWRDELARLIQDEDEDQSKVNERAKKMRDRAVEKLLELHLIGKDGQWAWRTRRRVKGIDRPYTADRAETAVPPPPDDLDKHLLDDVPFRVN